MNKKDTAEELENFEKELLGSTVREMFFKINTETERRFLEIKEKFFSSGTDREEEIYIETLLVDENEVFKFDNAFYPVVKEKSDILELEDSDMYLDTVYIDLPYYQLKDIEEEKFEGWVNLNNESCNIKVIFEQDKRYMEKIRRLYNAFEFNGQKWNTLNMTHIKRMYRIKIVEYDFENLNSDNDFSNYYPDSGRYRLDSIYKTIVRNRNKIEYNFGYYGENIKKDKKLLWNVEEKQIISTIFARPTKTDISFEYILKFENDERIMVEECGKTDILCSHIENRNELNIISRRDDIDLWNIFSVKSIETCQKSTEINLEKRFPYTYFTNCRRKNFVDKIRNCHNNSNIRSRAYIEKVFQDYDFIRNIFCLKDINTKRKIERNIDTYNCNEFIKTDFDMFQKNEKINLNIIAECIKRDKYTEDMLSFIISEIQMKIPEYRCRGYLYERE